MTWEELDAFGAKLSAAPDCMLIMWVPKPLVVRASVMLVEWGWDPLRTTSMIWLKMQGEKIWTGRGKRLRDQHESIVIAARGAVPPALPMWGSVLVAPVGEPSEKPRALAEMIDRDYESALTRIEMFARPPFDRRGWYYWGDAVPGGLMLVPRIRSRTPPPTALSVSQTLDDRGFAMLEVADRPDPSRIRGSRRCLRPMPGVRRGGVRLRRRSAVVAGARPRRPYAQARRGPAL
jgi:N6-adenosine-specific RNA methylase IME4